MNIRKDWLPLLGVSYTDVVVLVDSGLSSGVITEEMPKNTIFSREVTPPLLVHKERLKIVVNIVCSGN